MQLLIRHLLFHAFLFASLRLCSCGGDSPLSDNMSLVIPPPPRFLGFPPRSDVVPSTLDPLKIYLLVSCRDFGAEEESSAHSNGGAKDLAESLSLSLLLFGVADSQSACSAEDDTSKDVDSHSQIAEICSRPRPSRPSVCSRGELKLLSSEAPDQTLYSINFPVPDDFSPSSIDQDIDASSIPQTLFLGQDGPATAAAFCHHFSTLFRLKYDGWLPCFSALVPIFESYTKGDFEDHVWHLARLRRDFYKREYRLQTNVPPAAVNGCWGVEEDGKANLPCAMLWHSTDKAYLHGYYRTYARAFREVDTRYASVCASHNPFDCLVLLPLL